MGVFYTLNVFFMQFYLGTQRYQLAYKGDTDNAYASFGNIVVAFAFVTIPIIGWLLDKKVGYRCHHSCVDRLQDVLVLTRIKRFFPCSFLCRDLDGLLGLLTPWLC